MRKNEKKTLLITIIIGVIIIGGLILWTNSRKAKPTSGNETNTNTEEFVEVLEDGSKLNKSEQFSKTKQLDGLEIRDIQFREIGGITTLLATVENKSGKAVEKRWIKVDVLDKSGNTITTVRGIINAMNAGETTQLNMGVTADVANAYDFKVSNF